jgi:hypothetical protein
MDAKLQITWRIAMSSSDPIEIMKIVIRRDRIKADAV